MTLVAQRTAHLSGLHIRISVHILLDCFMFDGLANPRVSRKFIHNFLERQINQKTQIFHHFKVLFGK